MPNLGALVPPPAAAGPVLAQHLLGIGPWNSSVFWRGAPNYGLTAGRWASAPLLNLPQPDTLSVTLRLGEAGEARTQHYFPRDQAVIIEENITDLWWRRRDPTRGVVDAIGRFNAKTVDLSLGEGGQGLDAACTFVDYQGLLEDRLIMRYKVPPAPVVPPTTPPTYTNGTTQWAAGTYVTDILQWAVPTNMGLDLTGIQPATRAITSKTKVAFQIPLGTPIKDMMANLLTVSDVAWEWWVEMPVSDLNRPALYLTTLGRGNDRGVVLFDVGGAGPLDTWSLQKAGDRYANAIYFMGHDGGVVLQYDDQIALYGQRDWAENDDTVLGNLDGNGYPYLVVAAAQTKLAELAAAQPTYDLVLRPGFWEGRGHIDVGDWITVNLELGQDVIWGKYRVNEIQIEIDRNGMEQVTVSVGARKPSKDPRSRASSTARLVRYLKKYVDPSTVVQSV